jgi:hypothetical protein
LVALRTAWFHARQDAEGLAGYNALLTDLLPAEAQFLIDRPGLARLRARLSDSVDERQSLLRTAHELSLARTQAYQASSTGFVADRWALLTFAAENVAFGDELAATVAPDMIDNFKNGAFAWLVDHKYANLALCHAISGDLDEAMKQMRLAVDYGFNELFRFEQLNVFDDREGVFNGLGELPEFQSLIEQVRARNAELRTHVRENMPELSDPEWVATSSAG